MPDMFGTPIGARLAEQDELRRIQQGIQSAQGLAELAQQPQIQELRGEQIRNQRLQGNAMAEEALQRRKFAELSTQVPQTGDMVKDLESFARSAMGAGFTEQASKLVNTIGTIRAREAQTAAQQATQRKAQLDGQLKLVDRANTLFSTVKDQAGFDYANAMFQLQTGMPSPYAGVAYSPTLVQKIQDGLLSAKERAELNLRKLDTESKRANRQSAIDFRNFRRGILDADAKIRREREDRLAKSGGGKAVSGPSKGEVDQSERLIREEFPELSNAGSVAYTLASEARELKQKNNALGSAQALQMAFNAAKQRGDFVTQAGGMFSKDTVKFVNQGKSPETAISLGANIKQSELVNGRYYVNDRGDLAQWTGKGFKPVRRAPGQVAAGRLSVAPAADEDTDLDNDDE